MRVLDLGPELSSGKLLGIQAQLRARSLQASLCGSTKTLLQGLT